MISIFEFIIFSSEEWKKLKSSDREKLGIVFENDGEFWLVHVLFFNIFYPLFGVVVLAYLWLLFFTCFEFCAHPY